MLWVFSKTSLSIAKTGKHGLPVDVELKGCLVATTFSAKLKPIIRLTAVISSLIAIPLLITLLIAQICSGSDIKPLPMLSSTVNIETHSQPSEPRYMGGEQLTQEVIPFDNPVVMKNNYQGFWREVEMVVTAYCPCEKCCGHFADGRTACNHKIHHGDRFVAADKMYGFGTEMVIPGYNSTKIVKVLDRGRVIKGNKLDVFFNTHQEAKEWGCKKMKVLVKD